MDEKSVIVLVFAICLVFVSGCSNESLLQKAIDNKDISYCKKMSDGFLIWR